MKILKEENIQIQQSQELTEPQKRFLSLREKIDDFSEKKKHINHKNINFNEAYE